MSHLDTLAQPPEVNFIETETNSSNNEPEKIRVKGILKTPLSESERFIRHFKKNFKSTKSVRWDETDGIPKQNGLLLDLLIKSIKLDVDSSPNDKIIETTYVPMEENVPTLEVPTPTTPGFSC
jgi:hypothetical protein